jgi:hypothetical protein
MLIMLRWSSKSRCRVQVTSNVRPHKMPSHRPASYLMKYILQGHAIVISLVLSSFSQAAQTERWVEYYRTGSGQPIEWDLHEMDLNSIRKVNEFVQYNVRVRYSEGKTSTSLHMQVDCLKRTRGQFPSPAMRDTFSGTLGRIEVDAACLASTKIGK